MNKRRVVITGLGLVTPMGNTVEEAWKNTLAGNSGISTITHFDAGGYPVRIAGLVKNLDLDAFIPRKDQKKMGTFIHYGMAAGIQAVHDAGMDTDKVDPYRIGVAIGSGIGGISGIEKGRDTILNSGPRRISPFFVPANIINMISGNLSIRFGFKGPNFSIVTACATGTHNISEAARIIEHGDADAMVAGGAEFASSPTSMAGFANAKALSTRNDEPQKASRPWDRDRDGFVLSDGAGCLVLEEYERARRRGAGIYAELIGSAMNGDAYHITAPTEDGSGADHCMRLALEDAGVNLEDVDYINAHGTSTPLGDVAETLAVKRTFGEHAKSLVISSTKSTTGHTLGAAGAIEALFTVMAIKDGVVPPTINLKNQDPECDLYYTPNVALERKVRIALSNSFGFGGTNGTLVFRQPD